MNNNEKPHFAEFSKTPHIGNCNGESLHTDDEAGGKSATLKASSPRAMKFPEELIDRPVRKKTGANPSSSSTRPPPTLDEIRQRRLSPSKGGTAKATAYLLQPSIEARNMVSSEAYGKFPEKKDAKARNEWIEKTLSDMPLKLDDVTNYHKGFKTLAYPDRQRRIYSDNGSVVLADDAFKIIGASSYKKDNSLVPFAISIPMALLQAGAPRSHRETIEFLTDSLDQRREIKLFCFGMANRGDSNEISITVTNLHYLYLKHNFVSRRT